MLRYNVNSNSWSSFGVFVEERLAFEFLRYGLDDDGLDDDGYGPLDDPPAVDAAPALDSPDIWEAADDDPYGFFESAKVPLCAWKNMANHIWSTFVRLTHVQLLVNT